MIFLVAIPVFILIHFFTLRTGMRRALKFANFEAIARVRGVDIFSKNIVILLMSIGIIFLMVISASGITLHMEMEASSFSFVIAVDSSRSMSTDDLTPNRLGAAKSVAENFIGSSPMTTKMAVVSFSGSSYIQQDLTDNKDELRNAVDRISLGDIEGTDIFDVVVTSSNLLKAESAGAVIILSDGQVNVGKINDAINYANKNNIIINSILIGTPLGGKSNLGILSRADEDSLKALSFNTGGVYSNATDNNALKDSFTKAMGLMKKKVSIDISGYLLIAAILIFIAEYLLLNLRYNIIP
jgi:Ca-activated chloride channel homolog